MWYIGKRFFFKIHLRRRTPQQLVLERQEVLQRHNASVTLNTGRPAARADELERNSHIFSLATPRFARKVSAWNPPSHAEGARPQNFHGLNNRGIRFRKCISVNFLTLRTFQFWKTSFKTEVCSCSSFPTHAVLWTKEVEMVESADGLKMSQYWRA